MGLGNPADFWQGTLIAELILSLLNPRRAHISRPSMKRKRSKDRPVKTSSKGANELRIIGGLWRGRKLRFADAEGLRPTGDRIRETLFNWLAPHIAGANCLDLFSGSGALGLEALSRGAAQVTFIDNNPDVIKHIRQHLDTLEATNAELIRHNSLQWLAAAADDDRRPYDIIFLDPPFNAEILDDCIALLARHPLLHDSTLLYIESPTENSCQTLSEAWRVLRQKSTANVAYALITPNKEGH